MVASCNMANMRRSAPSDASNDVDFSNPGNPTVTLVQTVDPPLPDPPQDPNHPPSNDPNF